MQRDELTEVEEPPLELLAWQQRVKARKNLIGDERAVLVGLDDTDKDGIDGKGLTGH
nr:hypothetical protein [Marinicella sp. W31]MDC2878312.1 hypothetical protein [Marinicella sp. W31]